MPSRAARDAPAGGGPGVARDPGPLLAVRAAADLADLTIDRRRDLFGSLYRAPGRDRNLDLVGHRAVADDADVAGLLDRAVGALGNAVFPGHRLVDDGGNRIGPLSALLRLAIDGRRIAIAGRGVAVGVTRRGLRRVVAWGVLRRVVLGRFRAAIAANPKYQATSAEQIVDDFRKYIAQMQPKLPELFTYIPGAPVTVEPIPGFQAAMATHYQSGTPDGKRPGRVSVAVSDATHRSLVDDEAVAYHEGIPGHHMQISVAQTLTGLPKFRLHSGNSGYVEGWALYAEQLGKEVGFYQDPVSDYGRLSSELFRAVRLVVDTGIHSQGWTRDQAVQFMRETGSVDEPTIQAEVDRYIALPGQALSYKLGQLKFRELRERAKTELGPAFDIRTFHDEMLSGGALPLDLLDARTNTWIAAQKLKSKPVDAR